MFINDLLIIISINSIEIFRKVLIFWLAGNFQKNHNILSKLTKKDRIPAKSTKPAKKGFFEVLAGSLCFSINKI